VLGQLYQAIIDAALYLESAKPQSTLSYITGEGESAFVQVNGSDLKFRDLKVFLTNRPEDNQMFNELRQLSQAVIQNGGTLYEIIELYSTKSIREMKKVFKDMRDRQIAQQEQANQLQQQQLQQQQAQAEATLQQATEMKQADQAHEDYQNELDRINKKEIALISAYGKNNNAMADEDNSGTADALEMSRLTAEQSKAEKEYQAKIADVNSKNVLAAQKLQIERDKNQIARENMQNDLEVAKLNAKNRNNKK